MSITIHGSEYATLAKFGLDDAPDMDTAQFCNEQESGYGDDEGEWFAVIPNHRTPDGEVFHVITFGTHSNDHSPGSSHNTTFELYRPGDEDESAEFKAQVERWESQPERLDDESDDDDTDDVPNLDAMDTDDLRQFVDDVASDALLSDAPDDVRQALIRYASDRIVAISHREAGRIEHAGIVEKAMERTYQTLPDAYRW